MTTKIPNLKTQNRAQFSQLHWLSKEPAFQQAMEDSAAPVRVQDDDVDSRRPEKRLRVKTSPKVPPRPRATAAKSMAMFPMRPQTGATGENVEPPMDLQE